MSKQPTTWDEALLAAGLVDPRNGSPSFNQLAKRAGMPQSTISAIVQGRSTPKPPTIAKIANALKVDILTVSGWVGEKRTERAPYTPPAEADLLTDRQRRAVDEIIRAIVAERASADHDRTTADPVSDSADAAVAGIAEPDGATWDPGDTAHIPLPKSAFELAAKRGPSEGKRLKREADARGEESQDTGSDEPA